MYTYSAEVINVVDGDTIDVDIDLGFGTWVRNVRLRLNRINAYETKLYKGTTEEQKALGIEAREYLKKTLLDNPNVTIQTRKKGKYGRWIAEVSVTDETGFLTNMSDALVSMEYAIYQEY